MINRAFKLRFRRRLRLRKLQVEEFGQQAEAQLERNFFRRLERLNDVRRFVATWLLLLVLLGGCVVAQIRGLSAYYQSLQPVPGGTYTEGIIGSFTNASPLYATGPVDSAVSKLLFAGLFTYDAKNNLVGDLAQSIVANDSGTVYTVKLKPRLTWQDGQPLTAADVAFTYQIIQNPDAQSPFRSSWQDISVKAIDPTTITFSLPNPLSSFPYSLTNGIVPKHILGGQSMQSLRTLPFNTAQPVGAGPFKFNTLEVTGNDSDTRQEQIALDPFGNYNGGKPKLDRFVIRSFHDEPSLLASYRKQEVNAMVGLSEVPKEAAADTNSRVYSLPMTAAVMTFFRTSQEVLSDGAVRQALVRATDTATIIKKLGYPALPVKEPILQNQIGYDPTLAQAGYDLGAAAAMLDQAGWKLSNNGIRVKDGKPLSFSLYAQDTAEYSRVANELRDQWRKVGVDLQVSLQNDADFQITLSSHGYDALLYGISIGKDPDVYAYWDSKNADIRSDSRLNFSEYKSGPADAALQAGRTRSDPTLRAIKYQPFLQSWRADAPAVGLYEPRFLYIVHNQVYGLSEHPINAEVERFANVQNWMVHETRVAQTKQPI